MAAIAYRIDWRSAAEQKKCVHRVASAARAAFSCGGLGEICEELGRVVWTSAARAAFSCGDLGGICEELGRVVWTLGGHAVQNRAATT